MTKKNIKKILQYFKKGFRIMKKIALALALTGSLVLSFFWFKNRNTVTEEGTVLSEEKFSNNDQNKRDFEELQTNEENRAEITEKKETNTKSPLRSKNENSKNKDSQAEAIKKMMGEIISATYGDFLKERNLSQETQKDLKEHLTDNQIMLQTLMTQLLDPKITDEEIVKDQEEKRRVQQGKIDAILNPNEQQALKDYQAELPVKTAQKILPAIFNFDWETMSEETKNKVAKTYLEINSRGMDPVFTQAQNQAFITAENVSSARKTLVEKSEQVRNPGEAMKVEEANKQEFLSVIKKELGVEEKK